MPSDVPPDVDSTTVRQPSDELRRFRRGELSEAEYLNLRVDVGMAHVRGRISAERFEMIRELLMELLDSDPVLVEMKERLLRGKG